ncbi:MAG: hypothetical protein JRF15_10895, partial [Deltaproteobacteria bacterium]|nr:hypothetical protein [Deltaproteobacteria bacterium]
QLALAANDYRLDGKGTIQLDNALDIAMTFVASQGLTADLIRSVKEIQYLTNQDGRFQVPLRLGGSMPTFRAQPDIQYATRQLSESLVQTGISKGLEALLGKPKTPAKSAPEPQPGAEAPAAPDSEQPADAKAETPPEPSAPPRDPTEELIRQGLGALLGGDKE